MYIKLYGAALKGVDSVIITIEVNSSRGITCTMVGLPDSSVKESYDRIRSALTESGYKLPARKTVINLAPADIRKEGAAYDLPIAIGLMAASEMLPPDRLERFLIMGELGLDGTVRPIKGALPIAIKARELGYEGLIVPSANGREAAVVNKLKVYAVDHIRQVVDFFSGDGQNLKPVEVDTRKEFYEHQGNFDCDFSEVRGQESVKRAIEVAAAGGHNLIMIGPPGSGKSMMAKRIPTILPPLSLAESLETTKIHSVAGRLKRDSSLITTRPFRSPHHSISQAAMCGGGSNPQPGEISLAHNGVLFLDELPEFGRNVLEVLRQPLEDRRITVARAKYSVEYPANFMLVASMNPCPCGYYNDPSRKCVCTPAQVQRYLNRISGPLMDRIDLQTEIIPVPFNELSRHEPGEPSSAIRQRVVRAREIQQQRYASYPGIFCNAQMTPALQERFARPDAAGLAQLKQAMERFNLSARAYTRILKVARTIADLEGAPDILTHHLAEAIGYRKLDRENWGNNY